MSSIRSALQQKAQSRNPQLCDRSALVCIDSPLTISQYALESSFKTQLTARRAGANCMPDCSTSKGTFLRSYGTFLQVGGKDNPSEMNETVLLVKE